MQRKTVNRRLILKAKTKNNIYYNGETPWIIENPGVPPKKIFTRGLVLQHSRQPQSRKV